MADSGLIITEASVLTDWERLRDLERKAAEARTAFDLQAALLKAKGYGHWLPAEAINSINPTEDEQRRKGKAPSPRGTWTSEIIFLLRNTPNGIVRSELKARMADGPMADRLRSNPNGFYNAVATLEKRGELADYKGRLFAPDLLKAFLARVRSGEVADLRGDGRPPTILDALADYIDSKRSGVTANDIVKAMEGKGMAAGTVYNNLSKAVMKNRIRREGKLYLPVNEKGSPEGDPEAGGVTAPSETN